MFCKNCGKELREGAKFCNSCGCPVKNIEQPQQKADAYSPKEEQRAASAGSGEGSQGDAGSKSAAPAQRKEPLLPKRKKKLFWPVAGTAAVCAAVAVGGTVLFKGLGDGTEPDQTLRETMAASADVSQEAGGQGREPGEGSASVPEESSPEKEARESAGGSGAEGSGEESPGEESGEAAPEEAVEAPDETPAEAPVEESIPDDGGMWKHAGRDEIRAALDAYQEYMDSRYDYYSCNIFYLNDDVVPEVVCWPNGYPIFLTYDGQQVNVLEEEFGSDFQYVRRHNKLYFSAIPADFYTYDAVYSVQNGNWVSIFLAEYSYPEIYEEPGVEMELQCRLNGQESTEEECREKLQEVFPRADWRSMSGNYYGSIWDAYYALPEEERAQESNHEEVLVALDAYEQYVKQKYCYGDIPTDADGYSYDGYEMRYIDGDDVPEVYMPGCAEVDGNVMLWYVNGQVQEYGFGGHCSLSYQYKKGRIYWTGGHMDSYGDSVYQLADGQLEELEGGGWDEWASDAGDGWEYAYRWDGSDVSYLEYEKSLDEALYGDGPRPMTQRVLDDPYGNVYAAYVDYGEDQGLAEELAGSAVVYDSVRMSCLNGVSASSELAERTVTHSAGHICDGDAATAWVEGADGVGAGQCVSFSFNNVYRISGLRIRGGYQKSQDTYEKNTRPASITLYFYMGDDYESGGEPVSIALEDVNGEQSFAFSEPVIADRVDLYLTDSNYAGTKYEDNCISEVEFY